MNLNEKNHVKMETQLECIRQRELLKPKMIKSKYNMQSTHIVTKERLKSQKNIQKVDPSDEINYFVRKVKNPKAI